MRPATVTSIAINMRLAPAATAHLMLHRVLALLMLTAFSIAKYTRQGIDTRAVSFDSVIDMRGCTHTCWGGWLCVFCVLSLLQTDVNWLFCMGGAID